MKKFIRLFFFTFFSVWLFIPLLFAQTPIVLDKPSQIIDIGQAVVFLQDTTNSLTIKDILQADKQKLFVSAAQTTTNFGNTKATIWAKLVVQVATAGTWLLKIDNAMLDEVAFYSPAKQANGYVNDLPFQTGAVFPFSQRIYQTNALLFPLTSAEDSAQTANLQTYYFRVKSNFPVDLPLKVSTWKPFFEQHHRFDISYGIYFGIMFVMGLYNFFVFVAVKDKTYLYYVCYVFTIALLYATLKGYSFEFLWAKLPIINFFVPTFASIAPMFGLLFASNFLHSEIHTPVLHKVGYLLHGLFGLCILANLGGDYAISAGVSQLGAMLFVVYLLVLGLVNYARGNKIARFFLLAWACYIVSVIIFILQINTVLPANHFTSNAVFFGSAIEVLLLSFALADKIAVLKKEKEASLLANDKLISEQKQVLTEKVKEQTKELTEANEELKNNSEELQAVNEELQKIIDLVNRQKTEINSKHDELQNSYKSISILEEIGKQVNATLDMRVIIKTVYQSINQLMAAEFFGIGIYKAKENCLEFDGFMENNEELPYHTESLTAQDRYAVRCFLTQYEIILHHVSEEIPNYQVQIGAMPEAMVYLPLIYQQKTLGVITVQSLQPHAYNEYHLTMLRSIASYAASALDNALSYREIEKNRAEIQRKNEDITASISYAKRIQTAMLPTTTQLNEILGKENFFVLFKPRDIVSGDFYWAATMRGDAIIAVGDCTGHGVPGAFVSMIGSSFLDEIVLSQGFTNPSTILKHLNKKVIEFFKQKTSLGNEGVSDGMDISILSLYKAKDVEETTGNTKFEKALFAAAMNPLYYVQHKELKEIKATKQTIGGMDNNSKILFESTEISLDVPTSFYLFTDGFQDQFGGSKNKKFMTANFRRLIESVQTQPLTEQHQTLAHTLSTWQGAEPQTDDICVFCLQTHQTNHK
jgi:serine phosphatase RsbU (regulator of sigma subunit)